MKNENEDKNQDNNSYVKSLFKVSVVENLTQELSEILKRAQETAGATDEDPAMRTERFAGGGHKLGGEGHPSQRIEKPKPKEPEKVKLTMWKDGFTINEEVCKISVKLFIDKFRKSAFTMILKIKNSWIKSQVESFQWSQ